MTCSDDALAEAVALIRHVRRTGSPSGFAARESLLPAAAGGLASMAAGLLEDLCRLSGDDPDAALDLIDVRRMERSLR